MSCTPMRRARTKRLVFAVALVSLVPTAFAETPPPPKPQPAVRPSAHAAPTDPRSSSEHSGVQAMAGRWSGKGLLTMTSGTAEPFRCTMNNAANADGSQMKQSLRCRGDQNAFDAVTFLSISGPNITGRWQDNIYSLDGTVRGTTTPEGMTLLLEGQFFQAELIVVSSGCQQTVRVVPRDTTSMKEIAADLRKC